MTIASAASSPRWVSVLATVCEFRPIAAISLAAPDVGAARASIVACSPIAASRALVPSPVIVAMAPPTWPIDTCSAEAVGKIRDREVDRSCRWTLPRDTVVISALVALVALSPDSR